MTMGLCMCKNEQSQCDDESFTQQVQRSSSISSSSSVDHSRRSRYDSVHQVWDLMIYSTIDKLVLETLAIIGSLVDNDFEPPPSMTKLHMIADKQKGWLSVVSSMVNVIPKDDPLGPAVITLLLDDCPLPTKETVGKLSKMFNLSSETAIKGKNDPKRHRNICIVLGCIAEKLAGPSSVALLTQDTLSYLLTNLDMSFNSSVILFAMIALEKFAQTGINKQTIDQSLYSRKENPLEILEKLIQSSKCVEKEIGFCAQWNLDNLFLKKDRTYSYENTDRTNLNSMLNTDDVSEYLKISADGLTARCDASTFESVRCTSRVDSGAWYYEATVITPGVMQIGWATKNSKFLNHEGYGIGDDEYSLAYDGCRQLIWYNASSYTNSHRRWKAGDIVGSLLDLDKLQITFYLNGQTVAYCNQVFQNAKSGFFAAASFMSYQQCQFNFGRMPFKYPPQRSIFKSFNDCFSLTKDEQIVLPRHLKLEKLTKDGITEGSCSLCFDVNATVMLSPCKHRGFCTQCALQLEVCPICRSNIDQRVEI